MFVAGAKAYSALVDCAAAARGLLAPAGGGTATSPGPREDPDQYLDAGHTLDIPDECG
jgi:hypothetical protein